MNVLIIGSGGREHALAWKLAQSPRVEHIFVSPGNGGTDEGRTTNDERPRRTNIPADWQDAVRRRQYDLVVVGPEAPLAEGIADALAAAGVRCFGPTRAAARLEWSKAFAKEFMARHGIPTGRAAIFTSYEPALAYLRRVDHPVVIKASGLAAGKGVIVPETPAEAADALRQIMV
ncbi:MAG: phosphoribosylamine--glycine ligase, partial [Anaerolineae bacterium]|nr:phosphoribosylamine--glycine ligase [Anaerolineae bacterium]